LKPDSASGSTDTTVLFPRPNRRGPIEAASTWADDWFWMLFPRPNRRGPIEATSEVGDLIQIEDFRVLTDAAPLKHMGLPR